MTMSIQGAPDIKPVVRRALKDVSIRELIRAGALTGVEVSTFLIRNATLRSMPRRRDNSFARLLGVPKANSRNASGIPKTSFLI